MVDSLTNRVKQVPRTDVRDTGMALAIAVVAWAIGALLKNADVGFAPGASAIAVFGGIGVALALGWSFPGARWIPAKLLPTAIVLMGFGLDLDVLGDPAVGIAAASALLVTAIVSFALSFGVGRVLGLDNASALALGAGGAICGNAAVAAVAPLLRLERDRMALVLAAVNVLGLLAFATVIVVARVVDLDATQAGVWAGATIHAVPQAIAAGEAIGTDGLAFATATKLTRVTMLIPVVLLIGLFSAASASEDATSARRRVIRLPLFVPGFILAAVLANFALPEGANDALSVGGRLVLLPVLAALGLGVTRTMLISTGGRVFATGLIAAIGIAVASLVVVLSFA